MQPCPRTQETGRSPLQEPHWREDRTCSYCGSIHPELLFSAIANGAVIGTTDKNYKIYVHGGGLTRQQMKFYFQHFTPAECQRFIDLMNSGTLAFDGNYGFYVDPFFVRRGPAGQ